MYRITPRNYTGLDNLDTGDAAGDAYFGLYELSTALLCKPGEGAFGVACTNKGILQIPGFNVYTEFVVEADSRMGPYAECNPDPNTGIFACAHWHFGSGGGSCWYNSTQNPEWATEFADVCTRDSCSCDAVFSKAVGEQLTNHSSGQKLPPGWPAQCSAQGAFPFGPVKFAKGAQLLREFDIDESGCCAACPLMQKCTATTWRNSTTGGPGRCQLINVAWNPTSGSVPTEPDASAMSAFYIKQSPDSKLVNQAVAHMQKVFQPAHWYSTQAAGKCEPGQVVGKDCWWRIAETRRNVNASCVNDAMLASISKKNATCFNSCPNPADRESDCWLRCLFTTIAGDGTAAAPGISRADAIIPFERAFADPSDGGCPPIPPCPEPCLPECWAVPAGAKCRDY